MNSNSTGRGRGIDPLKAWGVSVAGGLIVGLLLQWFERYFAIPEHSTLASALCGAAVGVFGFAFAVLLLLKPRWLLTSEAQKRLPKRGRVEIEVTDNGDYQVVE